MQKERYNAQTKTRFMLSMDLSGVLGDSEAVRNMKMNCYGVETPQVTAGVTYTAFNGYKVPIPNGNRDEEKIFSIKFVVSESMVEYAAMLKWINAVTVQVSEDQEVVEDYRVTADLWVLDSYLKPLPVPITYEGMFIGKLGSLDFDQSDQSGDVLKCSADFYYYRSFLDYDRILGLK